MKKIYFLLLLVVSFSATAQKQSIALNWLHSTPLYYNGGDLNMYGTAECSDGSIVATGRIFGSVDMNPGTDTFLLSTKFPQNSNVEDAFVAKYSKKGDLIFAINIEDSNESSSAYAGAIAVDHDDNIYITGAFAGTVTFKSATLNTKLSAVNGSYDVFLACYNRNGELKFAEDITQTRQRRQCYPNALAIGKDNNIYVTGDFEGANVDFDPGPGHVYLSASTQDIFFSKYDSLGNLVFAKAIGGDADDFAYQIATDSKGDILLCGSFFSSTVDFDPDAGEQVLTRKGYADLFFAKYDNQGNYLFAKNIGKAKSNYAYGLFVAPDNSFSITGSFNGKGVDFDPGNGGKHILSTLSTSGETFIAKYDETGDCRLAFALQSDEYGSTSGKKITCDSSGNFFSIGQFSGKVDFDPGSDSFFIRKINKFYTNNYITKYDSTGKLLQAEAIGNYDERTQIFATLTSLLLLHSGNISVAGYYSGSLDIDPGKDSVILNALAITSFVGRYDPDGHYLSSINVQTYFFYTSNAVFTTASTTDAEGNLYVCGEFNGRFDFDPGPGVYLLESLAGHINSAFFAKYSRDGKLILAKAIISEIAINDIAVDKNENIYLTGFAYGTSDLDPSDSVHYFDHGDSIDPQKLYGYFFAKYTNKGDFIFAKGGGQSRDIHFTSIKVDNNKNIYLAGNYPGQLDLDPGPEKHIFNGYTGPVGNMFIAKYDSLGNYVFAYQFGTRNSNSYISNLQFNSKGNIVLTGGFYGDTLDFQPGPGVYYLQSKDVQSGAEYIATYKPNGQLIGAFSLYGKGNSPSGIEIKSLTIDKNDNIYIGGHAYGNVDFDPSYKKAFLSTGLDEFFASYNSNGKLRLVKGLPTDTNSVAIENYINSIYVDRDMNIYVAGVFSSIDLDSDPGPDSAIFVNKFYDQYNNTYTDIFLAKYDSSGNYIYSYDFNNDSVGGFNYPTAIYVDDQGAVNYIGNIAVKTNFGVEGQVDYLTPTTRYQYLFMAQYLPITQQTNTNKTSLANTLIPAVKEQVKVYPNPVRDKVIISLQLPAIESAPALIQLLDMQSNCVLAMPSVLSNYRLQEALNIPTSVVSGSYIISVRINNKIYYSKRLLKL